jgi:hypothetical protein
VLIVLGVLLVLGGGACLVCVGIAASVSEDGSEGGAPIASAATPGLVHDSFARDLETRLRQQGIPATSVLCPAQQGSTFECELAVGADRAQIHVKRGAAGFEFDVPNTAFLDGAKLASSFATTIATKVDPKLRVPCFTGTLMKTVGSQFTCEVTSGGAAAGTLVVTVDDAKGNARMDFTSTKTTQFKVAPAKTAPRVVDFVCPPGKAPGGAVRGGCVCGSEILGTACGAPGSFTDVTETPRGCRFVCP